MSLADYHPGASVLHRLPPGAKILGLVLAGSVLLTIPRLDLSAAALVLVLALYRLGGVPLSTAAGILRPLMWIFAIIGLAQLFLHGWQSAAMILVRLAALILLASLVTLTTRSSDMIAALECGLGWLRPLGVNPGKVGLAISLALRFIPVLATTTAEVREAQRARGLERSVIGVAIPVLIRTLRMADAVAEAIDARGYDPGHTDSPGTSRSD